MAYTPKTSITPGTPLIGAAKAGERMGRLADAKAARAASEKATALMKKEKEMQKEAADPEEVKATRGLYQTLALHGDVAPEKVFRHHLRSSQLSKEVQEQIYSTAAPFIEYNEKHNSKLKRKVITKDNLEEIYKKLAENPRDIVSRKHIETLKRNFGKPA
ncbi:hypothetical protein IIA94_02365 [Patescibacteria group bacterium]|nr:hypothetical protein [Patescibacteria group bacterium]